MFDFMSSFTDKILEPGEYQLVIKQSVSANHLLQIFEDSEDSDSRQRICFPFMFGLEFVLEEQQAE